MKILITLLILVASNFTLAKTEKKKEMTRLETCERGVEINTQIANRVLKTTCSDWRKKTLDDVIKRCMDRALAEYASEKFSGISLTLLLERADNKCTEVGLAGTVLFMTGIASISSEYKKILGKKGEKISLTPELTIEKTRDCVNKSVMNYLVNLRKKINEEKPKQISKTKRTK